MQIRGICMQMNDDSIPRMGSPDTIFERLLEYINEYDKDWKNVIKGASEEQIERLREIAKIRRWTDDFPVEYLTYLRKMGVSDGGMCGKFCEGVGDIDSIIELYQDYEIYEPTTTDYPYFSFYDRNTIGEQLSFSLAPGAEKTIVYAWRGMIEGIFGESFEKFLFQSAFTAYERYSSSVYFSASGEQVGAKIRGDRIVPTLDQICMRYGLKKSWMSDHKRYIARGGHINLAIEHDVGICGTITGDDGERLNMIYQEFVRYFGAG